MGSVVGGLYAAGYSGNDIEKLTAQIKWSEILGGNISLKDVGVEEKSEFERYLISLDIIDGKPKVKPAPTPEITTISPLFKSPFSTTSHIVTA